MKIDDIVENLNILGVSKVGQLFTTKEIAFFKQDIISLKQKDIEINGKNKLLENFSLETVSDLGRFGREYYELLENKVINEVVDRCLNDKAVIHSYNAIVLDKSHASKMVGHKFHRDMPWFPSCRTSIIIMIPLVDYGSKNGSTQFVQGTHLFKDMPSDNFMNRNTLNIEGKAGEAFIIDSTLWHKAGHNISGEERPMIVIKYTLAPFKQQIDFCNSNSNISQASDIVKQRLGWNVRVPDDFEENRDWNQETRKFKSGQYDMTNTYIK
jgi:ectoine hydroxylase-related dioxygenase (phytanoyl-CoA dioxygenase family)